MSTRDRIEEAVEELLREIAAAIDDADITSEARNDMIRLYAGIDHKLQQFNLPTGPDPLTDGGPTVEELFEAQFGDGGPTRDDLKGTVTHDIG